MATRQGGPSTGALVAVGAASFESAVLSAAAGGGLHVVRRCVDVADLLATAATRQAAVALVSTELGGFDAEVLARLGDERVAVVGISAEEASPDAAALRRLGVGVVISARRLDSLEDAVAEAVESGFPRPEEADAGTGSRRNAGSTSHDPDLLPRAGKTVAVWGATGAPGRSVVALGLASMLAQQGVSTLVVDADVYGGAQAQLLGLLDESSGLLAAARSANTGSLDVEMLASHARAVSPALRVLTGLPRSDRWVELSPVLLRRVVETARSLCQLTILDCAFSVELDEEISYDTAAPRRNGATLAALELADRIVVVGAADPVGLGRLLRAVGDLEVQVPGAEPCVVVNRMRPSLGWSEDDVAAVVRRTAQLEVAGFLPDDPAACDRALVQGRSLAECAPGSRLARALHRLAESLAADLGMTTQAPPGAPAFPRWRRLASR